MAEDIRIGLAINLKGLAASQYSNYDFNSLGVFNGVPLGASEDGVFSLFDSDTDNGTDIDAVIESATTDFGMDNKKKLRRSYVGYEASGNLMLKFKTDDGNYTSYMLVPVVGSQTQHMKRQRVSSKDRGRYWMVRIENEDGCDFSIDAIDGLFIILGLGR